jgi:hypothetical protein
LFQDVCVSFFRQLSPASGMRTSPLPFATQAWIVLSACVRAHANVATVPTSTAANAAAMMSLRFT